MTLLQNTVMTAKHFENNRPMSFANYTCKQQTYFSHIIKKTLM